MKNIFRKSKLALSILLFIGVVFACVLASNSSIKADVVVEEEQYKISYKDDCISLLLSTDFGKFLDLNREDLSNIKSAIKDIIIESFNDDVDFSNYGAYATGEVVEAYVPELLVIGDNPDVTPLTNIIVNQLTSFEYINENLVGGNTYELLIKYYVDKYFDAFVNAKSLTPQDEAYDNAAFAIATQLINNLVGKLVDVYERSLVIYEEQEAASLIVQNKINSYVDEIKTSNIELTLEDFIDLVNLVDDSKFIVYMINNYNLKETINNLIMSSSASELAEFLCSIEADTIISLALNSQIINGSDYLNIIDTISIDDLLEVIETISVEKLATLGAVVGLEANDINQIITDKLNEITVSSVLKLFNSLYIDEELLFSKDEGISVDGLKAFLKSLPRPSEVMNWTDEEMNISWNLKIETSLCDINTSVRLGFFGDCGKLRRIAQILADHVSVYNDNGTYTFELLALEKTSELIQKFLNDDFISLELKQRIFEDLGLTVDELYNRFNNATIDEYIELLEQIDYKGILNKVLDGETLSNNLGITITDSQIDKAIDFALKLARKLEDKTYADILAFLDDYIDVSSLESEKLENLFNYFVKALNKIDDGSLSSAKIREWLNSTTSTNESVYSRIEKLANYEEYFDKLKSYVTRVYEKLPERYKEKTLIEYYTSESTIDASGNFNITKAIELLPLKVEDAINVLFDRIPESVSLRVKVTIPHVYKITYVYGSETKVGFLPAGVKINEYPGVSDVGGIELQGWVDEEEELITLMPERDITVTALAEFIVSTSEDIDRIYDEDTTSRISVSVSPEAVYTYKWYKDGELIEGATNSYIDVINVSDSGEYYCVVTNANNETATSDVITVNIEKAKIDVTGISWEKNYSKPYSGVLQTLQLNGEIDTEKLTYKREKYTATAAGKYTATIKFTIKEEYVDNYEIYGTVEDTIWEITKATIDVSGYKWPDTKSYVYTGEEITHELVSEINPLIKAVYKTSATGMFYTKYTNVGLLHASVTFTSSNPQGIDSIIITGSVSDDEWTITPKTIDVSSYSWSNVTEFVYDGLEKTVTITTTPYSDFTISYENNVKTNAGNYKAVAKITSSNNNVVPSQTTFELDWKVVKADYDMNGAYWKYTKAFTYNGLAQKVEVIGLPSGVTVKQYTDNEKTNAGKYLAKVEFNYDETNFNKPTLLDKEWEIVKADYDMSEAKWDYTTEIVYNGAPQKILVIGLPSGVTVKEYTDNEKTNAGFYTAKVTFNYDEANFNEPKLSDEPWSIEKATIDLSGVKWSYTDAFTFDKANHSVTLTLLPSGVMVKEYIDNEKVNAGSYEAIAKLEFDSSNYICDNTLSLTWVIKPFVIDVSTYTWQEQTEFSYDKEEHSVVLVSEIHEMVDIIYANNKKMDVGTYVAKANCNLKQEALGNYELTGTIPTLEWTIKESGIEPPHIVYEFDPLIVDGNIYVRVTSVNGISSEYELKITPSTKVKISETIDGKKIVTYDMYDIHFEKKGNEEVVEGEFKVEMIIPEEIRNNINVGVVHIDDNNTVTLLEFEKNGEYVEFTTKAFSVFGVVQCKELPNIIIVIACLALILLIVIFVIIFFAKRREDEDGNIDPFFIKLASCSPEIKSCYYQLKSVLKDYAEKINCSINAYVEAIESQGNTLATIEVKNAKLVVRTNNKKIVVYDSLTLNKGKKILRKILKNID